MSSGMIDPAFYQGKKVLITGHTGFKGSWMCKTLLMLGAQVIGYSLEPPTDPSLFKISGIEKEMNSIIGDVRNLENLLRTFDQCKPEIVIHMAAQPIVRESYKNPIDTYSINVIGTVNILECIRLTDSVRSFVNVTTDKVYLNKEWNWGYRENEELNGFDPYSNSKSCSELVTSSYKNSFFQDREIAISTVRAGNVIGGGDFAKDRIIPDCMRAIESGRELEIRNPYSTRPYQHVLEAVMVYLMIAQEQYIDKTYAGNYNVGPDDADCYTTGALVTTFCDKWNRISTRKLQWVNKYDGGPHEANFLKLECSKIKSTFNWQPVWNLDKAIEMIVIWNKVYFEKNDIIACMEEQINEFMRW